MICALGITNSDGNVYLALDATRSDLTTCQYVVQTSGELANGLPLTLSLADGASFGFILSAPLVAAWCAKMVIRSLGGTRYAEVPEE